MRSLPLVLSSLVTLAIGLLLGMWMSDGGDGNGGSSVPPEADGQTRSLQQDGGSTDRVRSRVSDAGFDRAPSDRARDSSPSVDDRTLREAIRRVDTPDIEVPSGDGVIRGRVVIDDETSSDDVGLEGVTIVAHRIDRNRVWSNPGLGRSAPAEQTLDEVVREAADRWAEQRANTLRIVTDADGSFELSGLTDSQYRLEGYREGYQVSGESNPGWGGVTAVAGANLVFRAVPVVFQTFDFQLPDGSRPESVIVRTASNDPFNGQQQFTWSPTEPRIGFRNLDGEWVARSGPISGGGRFGTDYRFESEQFSLVVQSADASARLIQLGTTVGVLGTITVVGDQQFGADPLSNGRVAISRLENAGEFDPDVLDFNGQMWDAAVQERLKFLSGDSFAFVGLEPGSYGIGLQLSGRIADSTVVVVRDGLEEVEFVVEPTVSDGSLRVSVFGSDGAPLNGCRFSKTNWVDGGGSGGGLAPRRVGPGVYEIPHLQLANYDFDDWPGGHRVELEVTHPDYSEQEFDLTEGQTELTVRFETPGTLAIRVVGAEQSPIRSKLRVDLRWKNENDSWESRGAWGGGAFGFDGTTEFRNLPPGRYRAQLNCSEDRHRGVTIFLREFDVASGPNDLTIPMPGLSSLTVRTTGVEEGTEVRLSGSLSEAAGGERIFLRSAVGSDGSARFDPVPYGNFSVSINGQSGSMAVQIPRDVDVVFESEGPDCMRVAIADENGSLFRLGLRSGDTVVRVNDIDLSIETYRSAWSALRDGGATVVVLRNGQRMTFELGDLNPYGDSAANGGTLIAGNRR